MPLTPPIAQAVVHRTKLWSQEVKEADPTPDDKITYQFGGGKTFYEQGRRPELFLSEPINE